MGWQDAPAVEGKAAWQSAPAVESKPPEGPIMGAINRSPAAALGDTALAMGSGALVAPAAGIAGLIQGTRNVLSPVTGNPEGMPAGDLVRKIMDEYTYEPRTEFGKGLTKAVSYPFEKIADWSNAAGEKASEKTGSPLVGAGTNAFLQSVPLILGRGKGLMGTSEETAAARTLKKAQASGQEAALSNAKEAGYVVPPTQANPSLLNQIAEGAAGKIKTAQKASELNQPVTNSLVRKALGIGEDEPLNAETLNAVRKKAGEAYERVRSAGRVSPDAGYFESLDKIAAPFERAAKDFPETARTDILDAVKGARKDSFDASSAVDEIRSLRSKADEAYGNKKKDLGKAYRSIAEAMEDQLGRHLESAGSPPEALADFRLARETIAKSYTVEKHLQPSGNVDARGLAADLKRKPLSGELKTVAEFGKNFTKAAQLPEKVGGVPMSPWEHAAGLGSVIGAVASGHPTLALAGLAPYTRPMIRSGLLSDAYQNRFVKSPTFGPSLLETLRDRALESQTPGVAALEMSEGQRK